MSRPRPGLVCALALALWFGGGPGWAWAQTGGVEVRNYSPDRVVLGGNPYVLVRGLLVNRGPVAATDIQVTLRLRRSPGGEILAPPAYGLSWLGPLAPGQAGPFSVAVRYCCPEDVGDYDLTLAWRGTSTWPYGAVAARPLGLRDTGGGPRLYGDVTNDGDRFVDASTTRVYVGFWAGERLVDAKAAFVPVVFDDGPGGMALGPGQRLPWSTTVPESAFERAEAWAAAEPYPEGMYPVPLGVQDVTVRPADQGVMVAGELRHCGAVPVDDAYLVLTARDAAGVPVQFDAAVGTGLGLVPGGRQRVAVPWPAAGPAVLGSAVSLQAFALATQAERPAAFPCRALQRVYLPDLSRHGGRP